MEARDLADIFVTLNKAREELQRAELLSVAVTPETGFPEGKLIVFGIDVALSRPQRTQLRGECQALLSKVEAGMARAVAATGVSEPVVNEQALQAVALAPGLINRIIDEALGIVNNAQKETKVELAADGSVSAAVPAEKLLLVANGREAAAGLATAEACVKAVTAIIANRVK